MNVGSLFTGVGGFDLGLERAGHRIVFQCEADESCRQVLRRHWPDIPIYEDVREEITEPVDLLCGGFPCQDLSVAGKRAGLAGERSGLFFEATRIADALLADGGWLLIENVPGLLSSQGGRDFGIVLASLAKLGFHDLAWRVLDSRYFGVPQRRRRVFILARRARGRRSAEVLLEPESGGGNHQTGREAGQGTAEASQPSVASTLQTTAGDYSRADGFNMVLGSEADSDGVREASRLPGRVDGRPFGWSDEMMDRPRRDEIGTLRIGSTVGAPTPSIVFGSGQGDAHCSLDPKPDGPRYSQMGNAVTVNVAEWIGRRLAVFG